MVYVYRCCRDVLVSRTIVYVKLFAEQCSSGWKHHIIHDPAALPFLFRGKKRLVQMPKDFSGIFLVQQCRSRPVGPASVHIIDSMINEQPAFFCLYWRRSPPDVPCLV